MKTSHLIAAALLILLPPFARAETQDIAYPTADKPAFIISIPSDWKMEPAEEAGDFFQLTGPTGAIFSFRAIDGTNDSLNEAIKDSLKDANKLFDDLKMGDADDWKPSGLEGFYSTGQGKDKKDGTMCRIGMGWCVLKNGQIAEFWFVTDLDDDKGQAAAGDIANSLRSP